MLPLSLQTVNQGTSDSSLKCQKGRRGVIKQEKAGPELFWLDLVLQTIHCVVLKNFKGRIYLICELCDPQ